MKKLIILATVLLLSGCASLQTNDTATRLYVQYATAKLMEQSNSVNQTEVLEAVAKARTVVETNFEITLNDIVGQLGVNQLSPADQLLVGAIINGIEVKLSNDMIPEDRQVMLLTFLDWVETAALLGE